VESNPAIVPQCRRSSGVMRQFTDRGSDEVEFLELAPAATVTHG